MKFLSLFVSYELGQICTKFRIHELFIKSVWIKLLGANFVNKPNASRWGTHRHRELLGSGGLGSLKEKPGETAAPGRSVSQVEQGVGLLHTAEFRRRVDRLCREATFRPSNPGGERQGGHFLHNYQCSHFNPWARTCLPRSPFEPRAMFMPTAHAHAGFHQSWASSAPHSVCLYCRQYTETLVVPKCITSSKF